MIILYWPPARLGEFVLGIALCAIAMPMRATRWAPWLQATITIGTAVAFWKKDHITAVFPPDYFSRFFGSWLLDDAIGEFLILALSLRGPIDRLLSFGPLIFAGEISFSIYMTHMLILRFLDSDRIGYVLHPLLQFASVCVVAIALSSILFLTIESPSRRLLKAAFRAASPE
jgi:peptidoglycan/LPS O-acetylase OafA/YrhL